jgi:hypothetical protein
MSRTRVDRSHIGAGLIVSSLVSGSSCTQGPTLVGAREEAREKSALAPESREWFVTAPLTPDGPTIAGEAFGWDVALSGNTAVVGAVVARAAYVFVRTEDEWEQQAKLEPPSGFSSATFAPSVAISGDTVIVGATYLGAAFVYERTGTTWSAPVPLNASDGALNLFGASVAISGDTAVVGAPDATTIAGYEGAAYVFTRSGSTWTETSKLFASDGLEGDMFGYSVAVRGPTVLVGAPQENSTRVGLAYFFTRSRAGWAEQKVGSARSTSDAFGQSVALGDAIAVVGAPAHPGGDAALGSGNQQGAAFVFTNSASTWTQENDGLVADDAGDFDRFGTAVAVSGSTVLVGAPGTGQLSTGGGADTVYVFSPLTTPLVQARIGGRGAIGYFGGSLELEGDVAAVGSIFGKNGAYIAELLVPNGGSCDANSDCQDGYCVDGVCCDVECSGACKTCASGACTSLRGIAVPSCSPYLCGESGACPTLCGTHADCLDTHYCLEPRCVEREPNGGSCTESRQCASGTCSERECMGTLEIGARCSNAVDCESSNCVDGFCCDQRCDGQCEACDLRNSRGTCSPVTGAPHGDRAACKGADSVCVGECDGEHTARCAYPARSQVCGASCSDDVLSESFCNGQGVCEPDTPRPCEPYVCADEVGCRPDCENAQHCAIGFTCQAGSCESGSTCTDDHTAVGADHEEQPCSPYLCDDGNCRDDCDVSDECTNDTACIEHRCVPRPPRTTAPSRDGGGCNVARRRLAESEWVLLGLFAMAACFRRKAGRGANESCSRHSRKFSSVNASK